MSNLKPINEKEFSMLTLRDQHVNVYCYDSGKKDSYGKNILFMSLTWKGKRVFYMESLHTHSLPHSLGATIEALAFFTIKEGDVEDNFFASYTDYQFEFSRSNDCEEIGLLVYEYENSDSEYHLETVRNLEANFTLYEPA